MVDLTSIWIKEIAMQIIRIILYSTLLFLLTLLLKDEVTYRHTTYWTEQIHFYHIWCVQHDKPIRVNYADMRDYDEIFWDLWDWSKNKILPKQKQLILNDYKRRIS